MSSTVKPGLRVRHEAGILAVIFLLGIALCFQEELGVSADKSTADTTYRGKWCGGGRKTEEEELPEQMRNELGRATGKR